MVLYRSFSVPTFLYALFQVCIFLEIRVDGALSVVIGGSCYIHILKYASLMAFSSVTMFGLARSIVMYYCYCYFKIYSRLFSY